MDKEQDGALPSARATHEQSQQAVSAVPVGIANAFAFGDGVWPGLAKLAEECGEVVQVIGKLMMTHGDPAHWSGNLRTMLCEEIADVEAAIVFVRKHCLTREESGAHLRRVAVKCQKFEMWHENMDADPPPPLPAQGMAARSGETGTGSTEGNSPVACDAPTPNQEQH